MREPSIVMARWLIDNAHEFEGKQGATNPFLRLWLLSASIRPRKPTRMDNQNAPQC